MTESTEDSGNGEQGIDLPHEAGVIRENLWEKNKRVKGANTYPEIGVYAIKKTLLGYYPHP